MPILTQMRGNITITSFYDLLAISIIICETVGAMTVNLVEIKNMSFQHENGAQVRPIFEDVDLSIPEGKITAILGPSGTGKTTLLRLIAGQLYASKGEVIVAGQSIARLSRHDLYQLRKRMGMLFQTGGLFTHLSVFENVAFALREHTDLSDSMIQTLVLMRLEMVGLRGAADLMPSALSGGMARRVALARAIAFDPHLIMYDEPFTGQDPISMGVLVKLIRMLNEALGLTSVIVSHDVGETLSIADYVYVIADKTIIGQGTPSDIRQNKTAKIQQFIQGLPDGPVPFHYPAPPLEQALLGDV